MSFTSFDEWYDQLTKRMLLNMLVTWCRDNGARLPKRIERMGKDELWSRFFWAKQEWHRELVPHVNTLWKPAVTGVDYYPKVRVRAMRAYLRRSDDEAHADDFKGRKVRQGRASAGNRTSRDSAPAKAKARKRVKAPAVPEPQAVAGKPPTDREWRPVAKEVLASVVPGARVISPILGEGEVVAVDVGYLEVKFPDRQCRFVMPDAFEYGYLKIGR